MAIDLNNPAPGSLPEDVFSHLADDADFTNPAVVNALRAHFVDGMGKKEACTVSGISKSYFSQSLKRLNARMAFGAKLLSLCAPEIQRNQDTLKGLLTDTLEHCDSLRSSLEAAVTETGK